MKKLHKQKFIIFSMFLILFIGCTAQRTFTNVNLKEGDYSFDKPHKLAYTITYKENGEPKSSREGEVLGYLEDAFADVGFAKPSSKASSTGSMHIDINYIDNLAEQVAKAFVTGYTYGLIGYHSKDEIIMDIELTLNGEIIKKDGYKHEISTIAGLFQEGKVTNKTEMDRSRAFEKAAQQLVLKFLNDIK
tara:strand:- start:120 stop:689 length:570 start_codon:yes stop_codon:yes gene_type:complete